MMVRGIRVLLKTGNIFKQRQCCRSCLERTDRSRIYGTISRVSYATAVPEESREVKPFIAIPGPRPLPLIGTMYTLPKTLREKNANVVLDRNNKKYGPIIREQFGPKLENSLITLFDKDALEVLHRHDGKYPRRVIMEAWQNWRDESGNSRGILIQDGVDWKRMRVLLDKQMLRPRHVSGFGDNFGEVSTDFIERLRKLRDKENKVVQKLDLELFYWSLESIGTVLYEKRFGGFSDKRDPEMDEFILAVHNMFVTTSYVFYLPRKINKKVIPKWQNLHDQSWATIFKQGKKEIDNKCVEIQKQLEDGKEVTGFLSTLIASKVMSMEEIYGNISELMAAAVDTTSNTMQWVIYALSTNLDVQETLRNEVLSVAPRGCAPTAEQVQKMPYMKGFVKEILRLYPVANADTRITNEDLVLCGYHVPKDTRMMGAVYVLGRNPDYFQDPMKLKPERWIRSSGEQNIHTFAWLPFGYGTRMCIGRRVAELEIYILTSLLLQEFDLVSADPVDNPPITSPLVVPEHPVLAQFIDR